MTTPDPVGSFPTDYQRLERFIESAPAGRHALAIVVCDDRDQLRVIMETAARQAEAVGRRVRWLAPHDDFDLESDLLIEVLAETAKTADAIFIMPADPLVLDDLRGERLALTMADLNVARDQLPARVRTLLIFAFSPAGELAFTRQARDLSDVVLSRYRFEATPRALSIPYSPFIPDWMYIANPEQRAKLERERDAIEESLTAPDLQEPVRADHEARLGRVLAMLGDFDRAEVMLRSAADRHLALGHRTAALWSLDPLSYLASMRGDHDAARTIIEAEILPICEGDDLGRERAVAHGRLADLLIQDGQFDEALRLCKDVVMPVQTVEADPLGHALCLGRIAHIKGVHGETDEALRIIRDEQLPLLQQPGNERSRAVAIGRLADILVLRGDLEEALRLHRDEALPVLAQIGDIREVAVTQGKIADILSWLGKLDEALRVRCQSELPAYERLGDMRQQANTKARVAELQLRRGRAGAAVRTLTSNVLPALDLVGDVRSSVNARSVLVQALLARGMPNDGRRATDVAARALADARQHDLPECGQLEALAAHTSRQASRRRRSSRA